MCWKEQEKCRVWHPNSFNSFKWGTTKTSFQLQKTNNVKIKPEITILQYCWVNEARSSNGLFFPQFFTNSWYCLNRGDIEHCFLSSSEMYMEMYPGQMLEQGTPKCTPSYWGVEENILCTISIIFFKIVFISLLSHSLFIFILLYVFIM